MCRNWNTCHGIIFKGNVALFYTPKITCSKMESKFVMFFMTRATNKSNEIQASLEIKQVFFIYKCNRARYKQIEPGIYKAR